MDHTTLGHAQPAEIIERKNEPGARKTSDSDSSPAAGARMSGRFARVYAPLAACLLPFAAYIATMSRGLAWGDGIELSAVCATLGIAHPTGYPLFTMLGHAFTWLPVGSVYFRVTLMCGASVALASLLLYWIFMRLGGERWSKAFPSEAGRAALALAGALTFAWSRGPWGQATLTEVYSMQVAFECAGIAVALWVLARGGGGSGAKGSALGAGGGKSGGALPLAVFAFILGLAVTHHLLLLTLGPLFAVVAWVSIVGRARLEALRPQSTRRSGWGPLSLRYGAASALGFVIGLLPWVYLPVRASQSPALNWGDPSSFEQFRWVVTGGEFRTYRLLKSSPGHDFTGEEYRDFFLARIGQLSRYVGGQIIRPADQDNPVYGFLILFAVVVSAWGFRVLWRRDRALVFGVGGALGLYSVVLFTYNILDIEDYFAGFYAYLWLAMWMGVADLVCLGAGEWSRLGEAARARRVAWLALAIPAAAFFFNYKESDRSRESLPDLYAVRLMRNLPAGALLLTGGDMDIYTAWYLQEVEDERPDVLVYGANFVSNKWYMARFRGRNLGSRHVGVAPGPPTTDVAFVNALSRSVIEPNLAAGTQIFTTLDIPAFARRYHLEPYQALLTPEEVEQILAQGVLAMPPPILYRVEPPGGSSAAPAPSPSSAKTE